MAVALTITFAITVACFIGIWLINVITKDAGVIDYYWGPGFAVVAGIHLYLHGYFSIYEWVLFGAVSLWALRLSCSLIKRHHASTGEDGRYLEMRKNGGPNFWWTSLFKVFILQAVLLWLIAAPLHVAFGANFNPIISLFWLGIALFSIGFAVEWVADRQLVQGKLTLGHSYETSSLFTGGLWGLSRHPNYVGEMTLWWGIAVAAFALSGSWLAFAGPALLMLVMIGVSIPLTEQHMERTRPDYANYKAAVPMLVSFNWRINGLVPGKTSSRP